MKALVVVDIQNDFCPGGALAVTGGDEVIPVINRLMDQFDLVVATQDWHPHDHMSFASNHSGRQAGEIIDLEGEEQVLWPDHCVQESMGAEFVKSLNQKKIERIFRKGTDKWIDSYSGFFDNGHRKATGLGNYLKEKGVTEVYLAGLATDYCVKYSALDAIQLGFKTFVIEDAVRGVELHSGDSVQAIEQMKLAGANIITSKDLIR